MPSPGRLEILPEPDRELLVLTLTCLSKAMDGGAATAGVVSELSCILVRLRNPLMRLQCGVPPAPVAAP